MNNKYKNNLVKQLKHHLELEILEGLYLMNRNKKKELKIFQRDILARINYKALPIEIKSEIEIKYLKKRVSDVSFYTSKSTSMKLKETMESIRQKQYPVSPESSLLYASVSFKIVSYEIENKNPFKYEEEYSILRFFGLRECDESSYVLLSNEDRKFIPPQKIINYSFQFKSFFLNIYLGRMKDDVITNSWSIIASVCKKELRNYLQEKIGMINFELYEYELNEAIFLTLNSVLKFKGNSSMIHLDLGNKNRIKNLLKRDKKLFELGLITKVEDTYFYQFLNNENILSLENEGARVQLKYNWVPYVRI